MGPQLFFSKIMATIFAKMRGHKMVPLLGSFSPLLFLGGRGPCNLFKQKMTETQFLDFPETPVEHFPETLRGWSGHFTRHFRERDLLENVSPGNPRMVTKTTAPKNVSPPLGPFWHFSNLSADKFEKPPWPGQPRKVSGKGFGEVGFLGKRIGAGHFN